VIPIYVYVCVMEFIRDMRYVCGMEFVRDMRLFSAPLYFTVIFHVSRGVEFWFREI
jgi:hypothetical protein